MDLRTAQERILGLMITHDVTNWKVVFSKRMVKTLGLCSPATHTLTFSIPSILANEWSEVEDTAIHEIAHALIADMYPHGVDRIKNGRRVKANPGHGSEWKAMMRALGGSPERQSSTAVAAPSRYHGSCPCGIEFRRVKRPKDGYLCRPKHHKIKWIDTNDWSMLYPVPWG